jgi:hypothetical protein
MLFYKGIAAIILAEIKKMVVIIKLTMKWSLVVERKGSIQKEL